MWKDDEGGMGGNMFEDMKRGIDSALAMVVCVSWVSRIEPKFFQSHYVSADHEFNQ